MDATRRISEYHNRQDKKAKELRITDFSDLRSLGKRIAMKSERAKLEADLGISADEIREIYTQIQKISRKLRKLEYEFENDNHTVYENRTKLENLTDYRDKCNNALDDGFREIEVRALQDELAELYYGKEPKE